MKQQKPSKEEEQPKGYQPQQASSKAFFLSKRTTDTDIKE
jgi:hypothetical protein